MKKSKFFGVVLVMFGLFLVLNINSASAIYDSTVKNGTISGSSYEDGSGFILKNGKTMHGITSEYDGFGFGTAISGKGKTKFSMNLNNPQLSIRKVMVEFNSKAPRLYAMHFKKIKDTNTNYEQYEVLSSLEEGMASKYTFLIREPKVRDTDHKMFVSVEGKVYNGKFDEVKSRYSKDNFYTVSVPNVGIFLIQ